MSASDPLEDYPLPYQEFYAELPGSIDYLNEIDPTIHDEHDTQSSTGGLSDEQVSQIAEDSLNPASQAPSTDVAPRLFPLTYDQNEPENS